MKFKCPTFVVKVEVCLYAININDFGFPHSNNVPSLFVAGVQGHPSGSDWSVASVCLCSQIYGKTKVKSVQGPGYNVVFILVSFLILKVKFLQL